MNKNLTRTLISRMITNKPSLDGGQAYKECSIQQFDEAMEKLQAWENGELLPDDITTAELEIMESKMCADVNHLADNQSPYAMGLHHASSQTHKMIADELEKRLSN